MNNVVKVIVWSIGWWMCGTQGVGAAYFLGSVLVFFLKK